MDVTGYDPHAVANAEAQIQLEQDKYGRSRHDAVAFLLSCLARTIADDVVAGVAQWPSRVERYRYLRDLPWDGGQPPEPVDAGRTA